MAGTPGDSGPTLPSFSDRGEQNLPDFDSGNGDPNPFAGGEEPARSRSRTVIITVVISCVVLLAVGALVLSQTVFRSALDPDDPPPAASGSRSEGEGEGEYIPDADDPDIAPPPPLFTQQPTTSCYMPSDPATPAGPSGPQQARGGNLEYTKADGWDFPWSDRVLPYMNEVDGWAQNVEGSWYSVVNVGAVEWPESEGGYPGTEDAAVAIFQCYATTAGVLVAFGEEPEVTDYRSEETTVDGHDAWIVQATYHFEDPEYLDSSSASVVTSIVVETDDGPQALASDVAADVPEHTQKLDEMIESLTVVS